MSFLCHFNFPFLSDQGPPLLKCTRYNVLSRVGGGEGREVFLALDKETNQHVAIKTCTGQVNDTTKLGSLLKEYMFQELAHGILERQCTAPKPLGLIPWKDAYAQPWQVEYMMVSEFCSVVPGKGVPLSAADALKEHEAKRPLLSDGEWREVITKLIRATQKLNNNNIYHIDLKPDNVMLQFTANNRVEPIIIDYGLACRKGTSKGRPMFTSKFDNPVWYHPHTAPELFKQSQPSATCDLYSISFITKKVSEVLDIEELKNYITEFRSLKPELRPVHTVFHARIHESFEKKISVQSRRQDFERMNGHLVRQPTSTATRQEIRPMTKEEIRPTTKQETRPTTKQETRPAAKQEIRPATKQEIRPATKQQEIRPAPAQPTGEKKATQFRMFRDHGKGQTKFRCGSNRNTNCSERRANESQGKSSLPPPKDFAQAKHQHVTKLSHSVTWPADPAAKPAYPASKPANSAVKPEYSVAKPRYAAAKPTYTAVKPTHTVAKPAHPPSKPAHSTAKPAYPTAWPAHSTAKPTYPTAWPAHSTAKPTYPTAWPAHSTAKPTYPAAKPAHSTAWPAHQDSHQPSHHASLKPVSGRSEVENKQIHHTHVVTGTYQRVSDDVLRQDLQCSSSSEEEEDQTDVMETEVRNMSHIKYGNYTVPKAKLPTPPSSSFFPPPVTGNQKKRKYEAEVDMHNRHKVPKF